VNELKTYYNTQAETQPEPAFNVPESLLAKPAKRHPLRKLVLMVAVAVILTTTALAASPELREAIGNMGRVFVRDDGGVALERINILRLPISDDLKSYIETNSDFFSIMGDMRHSQLGFESYNEVADFFDVDILHITFLSKNLIKLIQGEEVLVRAQVGYNASARKKTVTCHLTSVYSYGENESNAIFFNANFIVEEEPVGRYGQNTFSQYGAFYNNAETISHETYISPVNGIEAVIGTYNVEDPAYPSVDAVFAVDNVTYLISARLDPEEYDLDQSVEILKVIIDLLVY